MLELAFAFGAGMVFMWFIVAMIWTYAHFKSSQPPQLIMPSRQHTEMLKAAYLASRD